MENKGNGFIRICKKDLIHYYQACCFHLRKSTFLKAVKNGNLIHWPGLTSAVVEKYFTPTLASAKGHLNQERKFLQSTNSTPEAKLH